MSGPLLTTKVDEAREVQGILREILYGITHKAGFDLDPHRSVPVAWCRLCKAKVTPPRCPSGNDIEDTHRDHLLALVARWMDEVEATLARHACDMALAPAGLT